jgi:predicted membrane protein
MVMNIVLDRTEKQVFQYEDFVLWHYRSGDYIFPIPGVVVRQEEKRVIIRARVEGNIRELAVAPEELTRR